MSGPARINTIALWLVASPSSSTSQGATICLRILAPCVENLAHACGTDLSQVIHRLAERHATPSFHPHVTLLTRLFPRSLDRIPDLLRAWKQEHQTLVLEYEGLGSKALEEHAYFQYAFVKIRPSDALKSLRALTEAELVDQEVADEYFPHLSLMYSSNWDESTQILKELAAEGDDHEVERGGAYMFKGQRSIEISEVWAVKCEGKVEDWQILEKFQL
ncbi:uncharacterized protein JCM15063_006315 [Sporobolomyces koalae]|uniref:uncharacterized protein n=1 Tax=Sporobolomyces koalae TaxID=500713 RepID=UPI003180F1C4